MQLIVGLGNPGKNYQNTRHNAGFIVLDTLTQKLDGHWEQDNSTQIFQTQIGGEKILFAKPETFMNHSGIAINSLLKKYDLKTEDIIVVYDEIDLPFGEIRVRKGGDTAGHNGLKSIVESLNTDNFIRLRIGIARPTNQSQSVADYVLEPFTEEELENLPHLIKEASTKLHQLIKFGYDEFVSKYNNKNSL